MTDNTTLINFYAPVNMRKRFDELCKILERTRSSVLNELMSNFVRDGSALVIEQNRQNRVIDEAIREAKRIPTFSEFITKNAVK